VAESRADYWRVHVADWKASGLSAAKYGAQHGVVANTLRWWARQLKRRDGDAARGAEVAPVARDDAELLTEPASTVDVDHGSAAKRRTATAATVRRRRRRSRKPARPELRVAKVVQIARSFAEPAHAAAVVVELSEGRARITIERGADEATATRLVRTLAKVRKR